MLADHTKWGIVGPRRTIADLAEVDILVTDAGLPTRARAVLAESVGELVVADVASPAAVASAPQRRGEAG